MAKIKAKSAPNTSYAAVRRASPGRNRSGDARAQKTSSSNTALERRLEQLGQALSRARAERDELLEHHRASDDILRIIAESAENTEPVFEAITRAGMRLMPGTRVALFLVRDGQLHYLSHRGIPAAQRANLAKLFPMPLDGKLVAGASILDKRVLHIPDIRSSAVRYERSLETSRITGYRGLLCVPLLRGGKAIGALSLGRAEPGPFSEEQIRLVKTFADQAVIALENVRLFNETKEALERQTATADVLKVISASPADVQPVFNAVAERAAQLCSAMHAVVLIADGDVLRLVARIGGDLPFRELPIRRTLLLGRAFLEHRSVHVEDVVPLMDNEYPDTRANQRKIGYRSFLSVPMTREGKAIGVIGVWRPEVKPFSKAQIELLETFAAQSVIAIQNANMFREIQDRNAELKQSLDFQGASGEILASISSSITDTKPVFDAIVRNVVRLCGTQYAAVLMVREEHLELAALTGSHQLSVEFAATFPQPIDHSTLTGKVLRSGKVMQLAPIIGNPESSEQAVALARRFGYDAMILAPMVRDDKVIGVIGTARAGAVGFDEKQVALLKAFADQAVIAIENARLFNETKQALEQQTATSEILGVISSSPTNLAPVFDAILKSATELCEAHVGVLNLYDGERFRTVAQRGANPEFAKYAFERGSFKPVGAFARMAAEAKTMHVPDLKEGEAYRSGKLNAVKMVEVAGARTFLAVPLLKEGRVIGGISLYRPEVRPFTEKQIALVSLFANQAVIAMENVRLFSETKEALEQQTATSEILGVISRSPTDLAPVFDAILKSALQLCEAHLGHLNLYEGESFRTVAHRGASAEFAKYISERGAYKPSGTGLARAMAERRAVQIADLREVPGYLERRANTVKFVELGGARTSLYVPLLKEDRTIGALVIYRPEVRAFTEKQVALVSLFANQAVIAMENVRLFNETKEALERQTASSEVLRVISQSQTDTQPVFDTIVRSAVRLCSGSFGSMLRIDGDTIRMWAHSNPSPEGHKLIAGRFPAPLSEHSLVALAARTGEVVHSPDTSIDPRAQRGLIPKALGVRAQLTVPLLREGKVVALLNVARDSPGPFSEPQIEMLKTFADQAVIAIENVRLFNETKQALERQTATSDILRVISSSPTDIQPVFDAVVQSAARLCDARDANVFRVEGEVMRKVSQYGPVETTLALGQTRAITRGTVSGRAILERCVVHVEDALALVDTEYPDIVESVRREGIRTVVGVPLLHEGVPIGAITVYRTEVRPFSQEQIGLLETFAQQAVIAIENVRLFNETKEALEQQTAISEVLRVISNSPTDVKPVLDAVAARAARICEATDARIFLAEAEQYRHAAGFGDVPVATEIIPLNRETPSGRAIIDRVPQHIHDIAAASMEDFAAGRELARRAGWRTILSVPLLREDRALGTIVLRRREVRAFTDKQIALLKTFADQAAIAIENVRLFNETKEALEQQTATSEVLRVISASPTDVQPVFDTIAERAATLCGARIGVVTKFDGELVHLVAFHGASQQATEAIREIYPLKPGSETVTARAIRDQAPAQIADVLADADYAQKQASQPAGFRSNLAVPMLREGQVIGAIAVARAEIGPFPEKQVELLKTFAAQAVIAIENVRLFNETKEAFEHQKASADILRIVAGSVENIDPVFEAITRAGLHLAGGARVSLVLVKGDELHYASHSGVPEERRAYVAKFFPFPLKERRTVSSIAILEKRIVHIPDVEAAFDELRTVERMARASGYRAILCVPLLREGRAIGAVSLTRDRPGPFTEKQVELARTFADQAVIAIENVRLFNETKEALERQKASAEILRVISGSLEDTSPVFEAIVASCASLYEAHQIGINALDPDGRLALRAYRGPNREEFEAYMTGESRRAAGGGLRLKHRVAHFPDVEAGADVPEQIRSGCRITGTKAIVYAPMISGGKGIGAIWVGRDRVGAFSDKEIALLQTFADQAVIAIQNARLFGDTKEALGQQTAISEVLRVISDSPTDVTPVLDAVAMRAARICDASDVHIFLLEGDKLRRAAGFGDVPTSVELGDGLPLTRDSVTGRAVVDRTTLHIEDFKKLPAEEFPVSRQRQERTGWRTILTVPLLREGRALGAIGLRRIEARAFTDKQVSLLRTFADQAAIAIENVRLFRELKERTEALTKSVGQLTALGEVGQAISSTLDLEMVLKTIVSHAVQLTGLDAGTIYEYDERAEEFHLRAAENLSDEVIELLRNAPIRKGDGAVGRTAVAREPVQVPEIHDESYQSRFRELLIRTGRRALLAVPLMREEHIIGALAVQRNTPGPFAPEVVELLKTFATQSALAIQNARLFREIAEKGKQLEVASRHKSDFLASMSHELRTPLNALLGFNEMILGDVYGEVPADMKPPLAQMQSSGKHLLRLINNVLDLAKIEAGRMELALADYSVHDIVESVRSTLHPLAQDKGLEFLAVVSPDIPLAHGDPGRITQCLMNLAGNSLKFTKGGKVEICVSQSDGWLRYCVADTGIGIPREKIGSLFTEFRQTDATIASEYGGTGLGLSISKKFVELHGGRIWVESEPGKGSVFTFEVPLRAGTR